MMDEEKLTNGQKVISNKDGLANTETDNPSFMLSMDGKAQEEYGLTERNRRRLRQLDDFMTEHFRVTFGNRIRYQIERYVPAYVACGGEELNALDDILAKKVMRKLGMQNPVYLRNNAENLCRYMDELFGEENLSQCKEIVRRLGRSA